MRAERWLAMASMFGVLGREGVQVTPSEVVVIAPRRSLTSVLDSLGP
jgi:hypothetical protein